VFLRFNESRGEGHDTQQTILLAVTIGQVPQQEPHTFGCGALHADAYNAVCSLGPIGASVNEASITPSCKQPASSCRRWGFFVGHLSQVALHTGAGAAASDSQGLLGGVEADRSHKIVLGGGLDRARRLPKGFKSVLRTQDLSGTQ